MTSGRRARARAGAIAAALLGCAGASACGGDDDGVPPPDGPYGDVLVALCDLIERCPDLTASYPIAYRDRNECAAILEFLFTCELDDERVGDVHTYTLQQHTPAVDQARADACVAWIEAARCEDLTGGEPVDDASPCAGLLVARDDDGGGWSQLGESCESEGCAGGLYCDQPSFEPDTGVLTCRTCEALPALDEPCAPDGKCGAGLYCDYEDGSTCAALVADGGDCATSGQCASEFCNPRTTRCDGGGFEGDACAAAGDCRSGWCDGESCQPHRPNGDACGDDVECLNGDCDDATGRCGLPDGSPCIYYEDTRCASGWCDGLADMCAPAKPDGSKCLEDAECQSGNCDLSASNACIEHCSGHEDCAADEYCSSFAETCYRKAETGVNNCEDDAQCLSGYCNSDGVCADRLGLGDACGASYECYPSGYCAGGVCVAKAEPGAGCDAIDACQDPYLCRSGRCVLMNIECKPATAGQLCVYLRVCDAESYCDAAAGFVCQERKGEGAACSSTEECSAALYCDLGAQPPACRPRAGDGEPCAAADQCQEGLYCVGADATSPGRCDPGPAGRPCGGEACPHDLFCDDSSDTCEPSSGPGETCNDDIPCADGLYCAEPDGICQPGAAEGQPCQTSFPIVGCAAGLRCAYDSPSGAYLCSEKLGFGENCDGSGACESGACDFTYGCRAAQECEMP